MPPTCAGLVTGSASRLLTEEDLDSTLRIGLADQAEHPTGLGQLLGLGPFQPCEQRLRWLLYGIAEAGQLRTQAKGIQAGRGRRGQQRRHHALADLLVRLALEQTQRHVQFRSPQVLQVAGEPR